MSSDGVTDDVLPFLSPRSDGSLLESRARLLGLGKTRQCRPPVVSPVEPSDELLFAHVSTGSKDALGMLFRRHRRTVLNIAQRILRDAAEAEDLCQDVFLMLFQKARLFDASKGTASSWIVQIAYHRAMNRRGYLEHRQHYNTQELVEERVPGGPKPLLIDEITARNLLNRLHEQLSEEQKETLELHFFEGYSLREIAERTNQTLGNVRHHYYRALERLRSNLLPPQKRLSERIATKMFQISG